MNEKLILMLGQMSFQIAHLQAELEAARAERDAAVKERGPSPAPDAGGE